MAVQQRAALAEEADVPGRAMSAANVAFRPISGFITPRQFGPIIRIRPRRACSRDPVLELAPSAPISLNPAEMMMAALHAGVDALADHVGHGRARA